MNQIEKHIEAKKRQLKMLQLRAGFKKVGVVKFPKEMVAPFCPENEPLAVFEWFVAASNVWRDNNSDPQLIDMYETILTNLQNE